MIATAFVQALAWAKVAIAIVAGACAATATCGITDDGVLYGARTLQVLLYGAIAGYLLMPWQGAAARALGLALLTVATAFAHGLVLRTEIWPQPHPLWALLLSARVDAFLPFAVCALAAVFPEAKASAAWRSGLAFATAGALAGGAVLFATNLGATRLLIGTEQSAYQVVTPGYWTLVFGATLAVLAVIVIRARAAAPNERARVRLLMTQLVVVAGAVATYVVLMELSSALRATLTSSGVHVLLMPLLQILVASLPVVATYALLVERAVDESMRVRNVVGYRLASATLALGAAVPFLLVAWYLWNLRGQTVADAFSGANVVALSAALVIGWLLFRLRASARSAVDRAFVRTTYDTDTSLGLLHDRLADTVDSEAFAAHVAETTQDTLGVASARVLWPGDPGTAPGAADWHWLVPIQTDDDVPVGFLGLSRKRQDAPFTSHDRDFVHSLARQIARPLAQLRTREAELEDADANPTVECADCGTVLDEDASVCKACTSTELEASHLPRRLLRRLTVIRRLGRGSMGVVYEAEDEALRRRVALKTLPSVAAERVDQLREEAQAMARVSHPNVATVYQLEMWHGVPVIVMELFERGTLAALDGEPLTLEALKGLGTGLAGGLAHLHQLGLVHADVKPSNLGIAASGFAKIMDFGLTRLRAERVSSPEVSSPVPESPMGSYTAGTPAYLAPELVRGEQPSAKSDVWALAVSLFEIYTGVNPFQRATVVETLRAVLRDPAPDVGDLRTDATATTRAFFTACFTRDPAHRLTNIADFHARLAGL